MKDNDIKNVADILTDIRYTIVYCLTETTASLSYNTTIRLKPLNCVNNLIQFCPCIFHFLNNTIHPDLYQQQ